MSTPTERDPLEGLNDTLSRNGFEPDRCPLRDCDADIEPATDGTTARCTAGHSMQEIAFAVMAEQDVGFAEADEALGLEYEHEPKRDLEPPPRFRIVSAASMVPRLTDRGLIKGLVDASSFVVVYGASNSSKTFLVLHMAACIATDRDFFGLRVQGGMVVYVACEGGGSIANRIEGLKRRCEDDLRALYVLPAPIDLLDREGDVDALIESVRQAELHAGERCTLLVVDTLSQAMAGGNENGPEDMSTAVASANRLREALGCALALVHHTGKDEAKGARGHSSLRAATDTELEVATVSDGFFQFRATKQRDREMGPALAYRLDVVELGHDEEGEPVTTCVVAPANATEIVAPKRRGKLTTNMQLVTRCMEDLLAAGKGVEIPEGTGCPPRRSNLPGQFGVRRDDLRTQFCVRCGDGRDSTDTERDTLRKSFNRTLKAMQLDNIIDVSDGIVWFAR